MTSQHRALSRRILRLERWSTSGFAPPRAPTALDDLIERVARAGGVQPDEITGQSRGAALVRARHAAMFLARQRLGLSLPEIGRAFGHRHHTSVLHAINRVARGAHTDPFLATLLREAS